MDKKAAHLTPEDWLKAGLTSIKKTGPSALRAERLMHEVGTSKGSFYWHFKDVPAYKAQLLAFWEQNVSQSDPARHATPMERLFALATARDDPNAAFRNADPAIRAWAREDHLAQETLARVDQNRLNELTEILAELGLTNPDFPRAIYATMIGLNALSSGDTEQDNSALTSLLATIVALAES